MKIKTFISLLLSGIFIFFFTTPVHSLEIKLGSIAPGRSPWDTTLKRLAREWAKVTNREVTLRIYPGEIFGNEEDVINNMREGKLGGGALTNSGFFHLNKDIFVLSLPFFMTSDEEFDYVFNKMKPVLEKGIERGGVKVITWFLSGWLKFFSERPIFYPDDLKQHKSAMLGENLEMEKAWRDAGYNVVPVDVKDLEMALQSGMVNAFFLSPLVAATAQYFTMTPNMFSLKVVPLIVGIVVTDRTWKAIPDRHKEALLRSAREVVRGLYGEVKRKEKEAVEAMEDEEEDLIVNEVPADALEKWQETSVKITKPLIGKAFSEEAYDLAQKYLKEYRELKKSR